MQPTPLEETKRIDEQRYNTASSVQLIQNDMKVEEKQEKNLPNFSSSYFKYKKDRLNPNARQASLQQQESEERKEMKAGEKLIDDLVKYEENYEIKREFMSESSVTPYSQIQNPKNQSEIITIRKCNLKASYADPNLSIDEMV